MNSLNKIISIILFISFTLSLVSVNAEDIITEELSSPQTILEPILINEAAQNELSLMAATATDDEQAKYDQLMAWNDPQYISDAVFFGKYDEATQKWTNTGYFDYEKYPELKPVQDAAMIGDYANAKLLCRDYYRERMASYNPGLIGGTTKNDILTTELLEQNMTWNENSNMTLLNLFTLNNDADFTSIDLVSDMSTILSSSDKLFTVYLLGLKKDGSSAEFDSRNKADGNPPELEITVNGVTNRIIASDDAYISPAANKSNNYGLTDTIKVEESKTSINQTLPVDANTKRGYIKFDLSSIPSGASITNATLKLYGKNATGTGEMKVVALRVSTNVWEESTLKYYTFEHAVFSWYGEESLKYINSLGILSDSGTQFCSSRFPEELLRFGSWFKHPVGLYSQTKGNPEHYAYVALNQWKGFLNQRGSTPNFNKDLDVSVRSIDMPRFMKYLINSELMTPELWSATVKYMWGSINVMTGHSHGTNNWGTFQVRGMQSLNCYFNEFKDHSAFNTSIKYYSNKNVNDMVFEDGSNIESALGYGIYALNDFVNWTVPNKETGLNDDLELPYDMSTIAKVEKSFIYGAHMLAPGFYDNQVGDGSSYTANFKTYLYNGGKFFNNPLLLYFGSDGKEGSLGDFALTAKYDIVKRVTMRTSWDKNALYLFADIGKNSKSSSHVHPADNNILVFAYGKYLLTDQLFYTYTSGNATRNELMSTKMHNTVNVDSTNHSSGAETINNFATNNIFDITSLTTEANVGASHTRNITFIKPGFWIITDSLLPKNTSSHTYDQNWHMLPSADLSLDQTTGTGRTNFTRSANIIIAQSEIEKITPSLVDGLFSSGTNSVANAKYLNYRKTSTGSGKITFDTVLVPENFDEKMNVETSKLNVDNVSNNGATAMSVKITNEALNTVSDGAYYLVNDSAQIANRTFGDYQTDAGFCYIEKDKIGRYSKIMLQNGTAIKNTTDELELLKSNAQLSDFGVEISTSIMNINSSNMQTDLTKLTIYSGRTISEVKFNGESVPFKASNGYIYFGDLPIIGGSVVSPIPPPTPTPVTPIHGNGGGGGGSYTQQTPIPTIIPTPTVTPMPTTVPISFNDLTDVEWAVGYINELAVSKIVSGDGTGNFYPNKSISREEFTKMILLTFGAEPKNDTNLPFKDVTKDNWAYPYIAAAYEKGIINGVSENEFGLGREITREDMSVIVCRSIEIFGKAMDRVSVINNFIDSADTSNYAKESVQTILEYGIINGDNKNRFNPKKYLTRAESAKVLCLVK